MNSVLANLFLLLQAKIDSITVADVKQFRHIDFDFGQLDEETPPLSYPAVLIDFDKIEWQDIGENCKMGEGYVILKLIFTPYSGTSNIIKEEFRLKGLGYLGLEKLLTDNLDDWCPDATTDIYSPFNYVTAVTNKQRPDLGIRVRDIAFSLSIEDFGNKTQITFTPVTPDITGEIV
jgi:hypothetical protein